MDLNDAKRAKLLIGGASSANINDMEFEWLGIVIVNITKASTLEDRWHQYWDELIVPAGSLNSRAFAWLTALGHLQSDLNGKWLSYWSS